jgi:hypothetical protein
MVFLRNLLSFKTNLFSHVTPHTLHSFTLHPKGCI